MKVDILTVADLKRKTMTKLCKHEKLVFGSGDYYVICSDCGRFWIADDDRGDTGGGADGERITSFKPRGFKK